MKRHAFLFTLCLLAAFPQYSASSQKRPLHDTWYERVLQQINPEDTDYGAIW
jgi:hypothetical protein